MTAKIFDDILLKGVRSGQIPGRTDAARQWYRQQAKEIRKVDETALFKNSQDRYQTRFKIGHMYHFMYDPKHKATLPYYDRLPLIFPINRAKGGFLGMNFHYLPLPLRAKLMDALYETATNDRYDETTRLKISYGILNDATKFREFRPTIKHYLSAHVRSRFIYIAPSEWDVALFLPTARFEGSSKTKVWQDSKQIIRGKK